MKKLDNKEKAIVKRTVQRDAYFAHTDQLLLGMYADEYINVGKMLFLRLEK